VRFFVRGNSYKVWNLFRTDVHLFGVENGYIFLFGTDTLGMDLFSRTIYGARISMSIGLVGVFFTFLLGLIIGGISGYFGGVIDSTIQRSIDLLISIPTIPLWMALAAALPRDWPVVRTYFMITVILSVIGWGSLARVVRGKLLSLREEDFVMAARLAGATEGVIIARHLLPSFASYIIVSITLSIPSMILGETALSFLGLGMQPPAVSWGVLLKDAQNIVAIAHHPWQLIPCLFVIVTVLMFNFIGDGLRDAADPYR
jgi:peptide/nickel transport system permease protein